jgi:acetyl esterase
VTDAACDSPAYQEFAEGYGLTRAGMKAYWECYLASPADRLNPLASPLRGDCAGLPPSYVFVAELDVLRDEGVAMAKKLQNAGVETVLDICPGMLHGFARLTETVGVAREVIARAGAWLTTTLG